MTVLYAVWCANSVHRTRYINVHITSEYAETISLSITCNIYTMHVRRQLYMTQRIVNLSVIETTRASALNNMIFTAIQSQNLPRTDLQYIFMNTAGEHGFIHKIIPIIHATFYHHTLRYILLL